MAHRIPSNITRDVELNGGQEGRSNPNGTYLSFETSSLRPPGRNPVSSGSRVKPGMTTILGLSKCH